MLTNDFFVLAYGGIQYFGPLQACTWQNSILSYWYASYQSLSKISFFCLCKFANINASTLHQAYKMQYYDVNMQEIQLC